MVRVFWPPEAFQTDWTVFVGSFQTLYWMPPLMPVLPVVVDWPPV